MLWYITCGVLFISFITISIMFMVSNRQNRRLLSYIEKDNVKETETAQSGYICKFKESETGCYFEISGAEGDILGTSREYQSKSSCINSAIKFQSRFDLEVIEDSEKLVFGKYSILIEKSADGKYLFKILSLKALLFTSKYYDTKENLLADIAEYKKNNGDKRLVFIDSWEKVVTQN